MRNNPRLMLTI